MARPGTQCVYTDGELPSSQNTGPDDRPIQLWCSLECYQELEQEYLRVLMEEVTFQTIGLPITCLGRWINWFKFASISPVSVLILPLGYSGHSKSKNAKVVIPVIQTFIKFWYFKGKFGNLLRCFPPARWDQRLSLQLHHCSDQSLFICIYMIHHDISIKMNII